MEKVQLTPEKTVLLDYDKRTAYILTPNPVGGVLVENVRGKTVVLDTVKKSRLFDETFSHDTYMRTNPITAPDFSGFLVGDYPGAAACCYTVGNTAFVHVGANFAECNTTRDDVTRTMDVLYGKTVGTSVWRVMRQTANLRSFPDTPNYILDLEFNTVYRTEEVRGRHYVHNVRTGATREVNANPSVAEIWMVRTALLDEKQLVYPTLTRKNSYLQTCGDLIVVENSRGRVIRTTDIFGNDVAINAKGETCSNPGHESKG